MCNKIPFSTRGQAANEARIISAQMKKFSKRTPMKGKLRPYYCIYCNNWHLTSKKVLKHLR